MSSAAKAITAASAGERIDIALLGFVPPSVETAYALERRISGAAVNVLREVDSINNEALANAG